VSPPLKRTVPESFNCASQPLFKSAIKKNATKDKNAPGNSEAPDQPDSTVSGDRPFIEFPGFSQPAMMSDCFTGTQQGGSTQQPSQSDPSATTTQARFQRLVKRMTRFWVDTPLNQTETHLRSVLRQMGYGVTVRTKGIYTVDTTDRRGANLIFKVTFIAVEARILLDFRLSRGCGLEFKRHFGAIRANCEGIVSKAPILWTSLLAMDALPGVKKKKKLSTATPKEGVVVGEPKSESLSALE